MALFVLFVTVSCAPDPENLVWIQDGGRIVFGDDCWLTASLFSDFELVSGRLADIEAPDGTVGETDYPFDAENGMAMREFQTETDTFVYGLHETHNLLEKE